MPAHDWTRVPPGIFHDFHHEWISSIKQALNSGILPDEYYSLAEQYAGAFGPDVLTLQASDAREERTPDRRQNGATALLQKPRRKPVAEVEMEFYLRKQKMVTVRHVSGDDVIAVVEIVSPGNKNHKGRFREFLDKAAYLLDWRIHLMVLDLFAPSRRDPNGIHGAIWDLVSDGGYHLPKRKPLTLVSYECDLGVRAYVEQLAVSDLLADMPLFLEPGGCVEVPLEATYQRAFTAVPKRWRDVLIGKKTA